MKTVVVKGSKFQVKFKLTDDTTIKTIKKLVEDKVDTLNVDHIVFRCLGKELNENITLSEFKNKNLLLFAKEKTNHLISTPPPPLKKRKLCIKDCGFHGDQATEDMCSVCYLNNSNELPEPHPGTPDAPEIVKECPQEPSKASVNDRCAKCSKRIGLLGFQCKCGQRFCGLHRHSYNHSCEFDHSKNARKVLEEQNQKLEHSKISKL